MVNMHGKCSRSKDVPPPQQEGQQQEEEGQESVFKNVVSYEYKNAYQKYFGNDESDIRVIKAIHSLDEMKSFIGERKEIIKPHTVVAFSH